MEESKSTLQILIEKIEETLSSYARGGISHTLLADTGGTKMCRYAPSFLIEVDSKKSPRVRYCDSTLATYIGTPALRSAGKKRRPKPNENFLCAMRLLAARERGRIDNDVFQKIVSGEIPRTSLDQL